MFRAFAVAFGFLSAVACKPPVPILDYHSVGTTHDQFAIPTAQLERQLDLILDRGFRTISLHDLALGKFDRRCVVLTFDDGFADALTTVLPMLQRRGMRATFFVVTDFAGQPGFLTWDGVRALEAAGMEIGSHTVDHLRLPDLAPAKVHWELRESKRLLDNQLRRPVEAVAYPYNSVRVWMLEAAAEAGYRIGVSGYVHGSGDPLELARYSVAPGMTNDELLRFLGER
ncbi:MAG TPA: polysaccharide deacetylase family protein [Myxococcales bacterium]|jgi:peptidoglycan/xylan/chitin deacetylase (PgdA/CDA1 family)